MQMKQLRQRVLDRIETLKSKIDSIKSSTEYAMTVNDIAKLDDYNASINRTQTAIIQLEWVLSLMTEDKGARDENL